VITGEKSPVATLAERPPHELTLVALAKTVLLSVAVPVKSIFPTIFAAWAVEARARTARVAAIFDVSFI
jgi:hypothetical protein